MSLRAVLIVVGAILVIAVYMMLAFRRRRDATDLLHRQFSRPEIPDIILQHSPASDDVDDETQHDQQNPKERVLHSNRGGEPTDSRTTRLSAQQLDMFAGITVLEPAVGQSPHGMKEISPVAPRPAGDESIAIYICAQEGDEFEGADLVKALNGVGMYHGNMGIFHHFGEKDDNVEEPVFSAANMFEPGDFDLGKIDRFSTGGVVLFMKLPVSFDAPSTFDLLLDTASRLSTLLDGELFSDPHTPLDPLNVVAMRKRVGGYDDV